MSDTLPQSALDIDELIPPPPIASGDPYPTDGQTEIGEILLATAGSLAAVPGPRTYTTSTDGSGAGGGGARLRSKSKSKPDVAVGQ